MKLKFIAILSVFALVVSACAADDDSATETTVADDTATTEAMAEMSDILATADSAGSFTTLLTAVEAEGLTETIAGEVPAADVVALDSATTVQGSDVEISVDGETVTVNGATVIQTDIQTSNGIIHVIDAVLLPPSS